MGSVSKGDVVIPTVPGFTLTALLRGVCRVNQPRPADILPALVCVIVEAYGVERYAVFVGQVLDDPLRRVVEFGGNDGDDVRLVHVFRNSRFPLRESAP